MVRVLVLAPIVTGIRARFSRDSARVGIFTGPLVATYYSGTGILTESLPNVVVDVLLASGGADISWLEWLLTMFQLMGIARALLIALVVKRLCRPDGTDFDSPRSTAGIDDDQSGRMAFLLLLGMGIWLTDAWHGLHPAFGALTVVGIALLPPLDVLSFDALEEVDVSLALFVAAVFAIADELTNRYADQAARTLLGTVPEPSTLAGSIVFTFGVTLVSMLFLEGVAVASILTSVLLEYVPAAHAILVMMAEAVELGTYFFPYQSGVLIAILGKGVVETKQLIIVVSTFSIASTVILGSL